MRINVNLFYNVLFYIFMFKEIKKYVLTAKIIIIMANLKNDVKFDSGGECKVVCICALFSILDT
jgi:hypothetical protein